MQIETINDLLDTLFDILERASMTKALEKGDERLAGEAAEARERIREAFQLLEKRLANSDRDYRALVFVARQAEARIAALESQLKSKHPCDETCPACWQLAKELTEAQERIKELEAKLMRMEERLPEGSDPYPPYPDSSKA